MTPRILASGLLALSTLLCAGQARGEDLRVVISAGFFGVYAELGPAFEKATGHRLITVRGPSSGEPVAAVVARGEAEIGFQQVSELIHVPGITDVGTLPPELQPLIYFSGAITRISQQPAAALALIRFLSSPQAAAVITKAGLATLSSR